MENLNTIDEYISESIKLLHSSSPDAARDLRSIVELEIFKTNGRSAALKNKLSEKEMQTLLDLENRAVGTELLDRKMFQRPVIFEHVPKPEIKMSKVLKITTQQDPVSSSIATSLFADLSCQVCQTMESSHQNPLLECFLCHQLFHAMCQPSNRIPKDPTTFLCNNCNPIGVIVKRKDTMVANPKKIK